jgi:hypothetical protein
MTVEVGAGRSRVEDLSGEEGEKIHMFGWCHKIVIREDLGKLFTWGW